MEAAAGLRVLLVDDNPADVYLMRSALHAWPVPVDLQVLSDGEKALQRLLANSQPRPDLLVLDMNLPRVSGTAVLETIRRYTNLSTLPVVLLSSSRPTDEAAEHRQSLFLLKPYNLDEYAALSNRIYRFWCDCAAQAGISHGCSA